MRRIAVALTLVLAGLAAGPQAHAVNTIQPGAYMQAGNAGCTMNFIYDGGGKTYVGTAAHCVEKVGQDVETFDGTIFGDVAVIGNEDRTEEDWALIEIRTQYLSAVSPAVKGSPSYPRGFTTPSETFLGDTIQLSGYGLGFDLISVTRERRNAVMNYDDTELYDLVGPVIYGDSGGPVVHIDTGKALGIVSRLCLGACTEEGPTVQGILSKAAGKGFNVSLRTV